MMNRIGIDLAEIERIKELMDRHPTFLTKIFTENERAEFNKKGKGVYQSVAGSFCVKEAVSKALGSGFSALYIQSGGKSWKTSPDEGFEKIICKPCWIETLHDTCGRPYVNLKGDLKKLEDSLEIQVSITHTDTTAAAVVLLTIL